jgi:hypothetical protein
VKQTEAVGRRFQTAPPASSDPVAMTTTGLVEPGVKVLDREAAALRALQPRPADADLERFIGLFDPVLELARQRLAIRDSSGADEAHRLELLITELQGEQGDAARGFGLRVCGGRFVDQLFNPSAK